MKYTNTGGSAFPVTYPNQGIGMTLRDYFAAKALNGILSGNPEAIRESSENLARASYKVADAMLKAREA